MVPLILTKVSIYDTNTDIKEREELTLLPLNLMDISRISADKDSGNAIIYCKTGRIYETVASFEEIFDIYHNAGLVYFPSLNKVRTWSSKFNNHITQTHGL